MALWYRLFNRLYYLFWSEVIEGLDDIIRLVCDIIVSLCHLSGLGSILRKLWYLDEVQVGYGVG
jgi:hypothetical protein